MIRELGDVLLFPETTFCPAWEGVVVSVTTAWERNKNVTVYSVMQPVSAHKLLPGLNTTVDTYHRIIRADFKNMKYVRRLTTEEMLIHPVKEVREMGIRFAKEELES